MPQDLSVKLSSSTTIAGYQEMLTQQDKSGIADFVFQRLTERYVLPIENIPLSYKNGFSIMANSCLLIENYESFRQGWDDTIAPDRIPFRSFFEREAEFSDFIPVSRDFYGNVRCGILHQGETKKGWKITRKSSDPLFNRTELRINANKFLENLRKVLEQYKSDLKSQDWDSTIWVKCRDKMEFIITNCQP